GPRGGVGPARGRERHPAGGDDGRGVRGAGAADGAQPARARLPRSQRVFRLDAGPPGRGAVRVVVRGAGKAPGRGYSAASAMTGSTRVARRTGSSVASTAAAASTSDAARIADGSAARPPPRPPRSTPPPPP